MRKWTHEYIYYVGFQRCFMIMGQLYKLLLFYFIGAKHRGVQSVPGDGDDADQFVAVEVGPSQGV